MQTKRVSSRFNKVLVFARKNDLIKIFVFAVIYQILSNSILYGQELEDSIKLNRKKTFVSQLSKFSESQIYNLEGSKEIYRLMIWQTFYSPILLRLEKNGNEILLISKQLSGQGGYQVGKVKKTTKIKITKSQYQKFKNLLAKLNFEKLPTIDERFEKQGDEPITICLDGANWILEGRFENYYHSIERYCPDNKILREIGFNLIEMSKLKVKKKELF